MNPDADSTLSTDTTILNINHKQNTKVKHNKHQLPQHHNNMCLLVA